MSEIASMMNVQTEKKRVLIFIVSYKAEKFIKSVLARIPENIWTNPFFETEVLVIDDESGDSTFQFAREYVDSTGNPHITVLYNPKNQGYGGNQKIGYNYAIQMNFDVVVLLHGDGQYPPEYLEQMILPIIIGETDVTFGSRMINKIAALHGHMPFYKWVGNQVLTFLQNHILGVHLAEFHTGFRAFRVDALRSIPFGYNSNYFDFDTDIVIQLLDTHNRILEIPIPVFYGDEVSRVNGFKYGFLILKSSILSRLIRWGIFYNPKFDYLSENTQYESKLGYESSHQFAIDHVSPGSIVLDLGSSPGIMASEMASKNIRTISVDKNITPLMQENSIQVIRADIDFLEFEKIQEDVDYILMLDIIGQLRDPEVVLRKLRQYYSRQAPQIIITTANIAFFPIRLALLFGQFNYGKRGILDMHNSRLFTFYSLQRALRNLGFEILEVKGLPAPFYLAFGDTTVAHLLIGLNRFFIRISKNIFSYQIALVAKPTPTLDLLLETAVQSGQMKAMEIGNGIYKDPLK
jgi:glycosyltransferase involved in cell wall biosynthesis